MAIENTYLRGTGITLTSGFDLQAKAPLDSRQTVPVYAGLQALIDGNATYEGMIVYCEEDKKTYQYIDSNWVRLSRLPEYNGDTKTLIFA